MEKNNYTLALLMNWGIVSVRKDGRALQLPTFEYFLVNSFIVVQGSSTYRFFVGNCESTQNRIDS